MQVRLANKITIAYPPQELRNWCRQNLTIPNPDYYKREAMGKWTGGTPESIVLYEQAGNELRLPFGTLQDVWRQIGRRAEWINEIQPLRGWDYKPSIDLYDYQRQAVGLACTQKNGILVMPCGAGKTQSGLAIIANLGGRALCTHIPGSRVSLPVFPDRDGHNRWKEWPLQLFHPLTQGPGGSAPAIPDAGDQTEQSYFYPYQFPPSAGLAAGAAGFAAAVPA